MVRYHLKAGVGVSRQNFGNMPNLNRRVKSFQLARHIKQTAPGHPPAADRTSSLDGYWLFYH